VGVVEQVFGKSLGELRGTIGKASVPPDQTASQPLIEETPSDPRLDDRPQT